MGVRQRLLCEAVSHLRAAERAMAALLSAGSDGSDRARLGAEFDAVEDACREAARHLVAPPPGGDPPRA